MPLANPYMPSEELLDVPILNLDLRVRPYNCLMKAGIDTLGALVECTEDDLLSMRNFGQRSLEHVRERLSGLELTLKERQRQPMQEGVTVKTPTGREITLTVGFRLPAEDYRRALRVAKDRRVRLSAILRETVAAGLSIVEAQDQEPSGATT